VSHHRYGKSRVRLVRIDRSSEQHIVKDVNVEIILEGDFDSSYTRGDNSNVVPTDTMKNSVYYLSKQYFTGPSSIEEFGAALARHFVEKYRQVEKASAKLELQFWDRLVVGGKTSGVAFSKREPEKRVTSVSYARKTGQVTISSGFTGLTILKTTGSGFEGFPKCELTTLPETKERMFCTAARATWTFAGTSDPRAVDYDGVFRRVRDSTLEVFVNRYSKAVQQTVFDAAELALAKCPEISEIWMAMPNIHINLFDIGRFGLPNYNEIYVPTDDPSGYIEATVRRANHRSKL